MKKRFKNATAVAVHYLVMCPFKHCEWSIDLLERTPHKGDIIECPNCRKQFKLGRIII